MTRMKKIYLFFFLVLIYSGSFANVITLDCNVKGTLQSTFENKNLRESKVTTTITTSEFDKKYLFINIEGEDDYLASANTVKSSFNDFMNFSNDNKFDLLNTWNMPSGNIKTNSVKITINRVTGQLTVSKTFQFKNGNFIDISYSGNCNRVTKKKF
jgi:hypothetical protein